MNGGYRLFQIALGKSVKCRQGEFLRLSESVSVGNQDNFFFIRESFGRRWRKTFGRRRHEKAYAFECQCPFVFAIKLV